MGQTAQKMLNALIRWIKGQTGSPGYGPAFSGPALLMIGLLLSSCHTDRKTSPDKTATTHPTTASISPGLEPPVAFSQPAVPATPPDAGKWIYEETRTGYKAFTVSPTLLTFKFPYEGGSTATLTLRRRSGETHVYVEVSKGQFNHSFQGGMARIRFDNRPAVSFPLIAAANGRANILFFANEQQLIDRLKTAHRLVMTVEFTGQDTRDITFNTANLHWKQA